MAIPMYGTAGALFNRLGKLGLLAKDIATFQATLQPNLIDPTSGVIGQYNTEPDLAAQVGSSYISLLGGVEGASGLATTLASSTINRMVFRDNPQVNQTLTSSNLAASITEVIRQMNSQSTTILQIQVSSNPPSPFTGIGNGVVVMSVNRPFDGRLLENAFAETVQFTCSADSYTGNTAVGNESFAVTGQGAEQDLFAFDWPLGSNAITSLSAVNGGANNSQGNLLVNSSFTSFTSNVPNNWTLTSGVAGVNVFQETGVVFNGGGSLKLVGDGVTAIGLKQQFGSGSGTGATLGAQSQYAVNFWLRTSGTAPSTGVLTVSLVDQNGTVIRDCAGVANSFTISLTSLSITWVAFNGVFRTPEALPSQIFLQLNTTTVLNNNATVWLDQGAMGGMTQLYVHGPFTALFSGNVPFVASPTADYTTCVINNPRGSGGTINTFQTLLYRLLPFVRSNEILFPSNPAPSVSDGLIG